MSGIDPVEGIGILDVDFMELKAVALEQRMEPVVLEPDVVIIVQVVEADDLVPCCQRELGSVCPDESGGSSDEESHE